MERMESEHRFTPETTDKKEDDKSKKKTRAVLPNVKLEPVDKQSDEKPAAPAQPTAFEELLQKAETEKPGPPAAEKPEEPEPETTEADDTDAETDPELETLDDEEQHEVIDQYVEAALAEVAQEAAYAEPDSSAAVEAAADEAFLHDLHDRLAQAENPEAAMDSAYDAVAETLETEEPNDAEPEPDEGSDEPASASETHPAQGPTAETPEQNDEPEDNDPSVGATLPPPIPPSAPLSPMPAGGDSEGPRHKDLASATPALAPETVTNAEAMSREQTAAARGLLVGGILGYLIGRRRGRIKTENKLIPIQKKLEKEVKNLHENVAIKEQQIRKLAAQKAEATSSVGAKQETIQRLRSAHAAKSETIAKSAPAESVVQATTSQRAERQQFSAPTVEQPILNVKQEQVTTNPGQMGKAELLAVAETVKVDNRTLRELYETHQLSEQSVRRVVQEHLRGGNTHEAVAREMVAKELSFERDPHDRAQAAAALTAAAAVSPRKRPYSDRELGMLPAPGQDDSIDHLLEATSQSTRHHRRTAVIGISAIAAIALALAIAAVLS